MNPEILTLRGKIDNLDQELLQLLEKRFQITKEVGEIKKSENIQIQDSKREGELFEDRIGQTKLDKVFVKKIFTTILEESRRLQ